VFHGLPELSTALPQKPHRVVLHENAQGTHILHRGINSTSCPGCSTGSLSCPQPCHKNRTGWCSTRTRRVVHILHRGIKSTSCPGCSTGFLSCPQRCHTNCAWWRSTSPCRKSHVLHRGCRAYVHEGHVPRAAASSALLSMPLAFHVCARS